MRVFVDACEMGDLEGTPVEIRKQSRFGAGCRIPSGAACARGQAGVALTARSMAHQKRCISVRWSDIRRRGWRIDSLRCRLGSSDENTS